MQMEPTERAWEMVSTLRKNCRLPADLEMEVYAGIVGQEAAVAFLRWCADKQQRPVTAQEIFCRWEEVAQRAEQQRHDLQAATLNDLLVTLETLEAVSSQQETGLLAYLAVLPRDLRFAAVKSLVRLPHVAELLVRPEHDAVVFEAIAAISREAS